MAFGGSKALMVSCATRSECFEVGKDRVVCARIMSYDDRGI